MRLRRIGRGLLWGAAGVLGLFLILDLLFPLDTKRLCRQKSTRIFDASGSLLRIHLSPDGYLRIPIGSHIKEDIKNTLLAYEDRYFYHHFGVNPLSLGRAVYFNLSHKRQIGASTLTMQLARMMHREDRTVGNKLIEMFMALQLEWHYTKDEILELYLDNTPYGGNIEGFASAAYAYFGVGVESLSLSQIAYLVSIPKNPNANRIRERTPREYTKARRLSHRVLSRLKSAGLIGEGAYRRALGEAITPYRRDLPNEAPHLARRFKGGGDIFTTLELPLQKEIEGILRRRLAALRPIGIYNAAAVVIDNHTMDILGYVGSSDFADKRHGGEVDGVTAPISPGSTLKPFVYAKALEKGLITPRKHLYDLSLFIAGYTPLNYSKSFQGEVSATEALQLSLNIPAVELNYHLGDDSLYELLKKAGIKGIDKPKGHYGSSIVLGGCTVSLLDIAELFAALANGGEYRRSDALKGADANGTIRLLREESSYLVGDILANAPRVSFSSSWEYLAAQPRVAFKTGTSANAKDLLTIGYTPNYTVAVWFGNFSGKAARQPEENDEKDKSATGLYAASPALFDIFARLPKTRANPKKWFAKPEGIVTDTICQDPIELGRCRKRVRDTVIAGVRPYTPCSMLRAEVLAQLFGNGTIMKMGELSASSCYGEWKGYKPRITSPVGELTYTQNALLPEEMKKLKLQCYSFDENESIVWMVDDEAPFDGRSSIPIYRYFGVGRHRVSCLDRGAKMDSVSFETEEK